MFPGAAALEVMCAMYARARARAREWRKETGPQPAAWWTTPFLLQQVPSGPESMCAGEFHSTPNLLISLPFAFPSSPARSRLISASRDSSPVLTNVRTAPGDSHSTCGHTHLSQSMSLCLTLCSKAWPIFMRSRLFPSQDAESGLSWTELGILQVSSLAFPWGLEEDPPTCGTFQRDLKPGA